MLQHHIDLSDIDAILIAPSPDQRLDWVRPVTWRRVIRAAGLRAIPRYGPAAITSGFRDSRLTRTRAKNSSTTPD